MDNYTKLIETQNEQLQERLSDAQQVVDSLLGSRFRVVECLGVWNRSKKLPYRLGENKEKSKSSTVILKGIVDISNYGNRKEATLEFIRSKIEDCMDVIPNRKTSLEYCLFLCEGCLDYYNECYYSGKQQISGIKRIGRWNIQHIITTYDFTGGDIAGTAGIDLSSI